MHARGVRSSSVIIPQAALFRRLPCSPHAHCRFLSSAAALPVINIPKSSIYELDHQKPVLHDVSLVVNPHESWAVVSNDAASGKAALFGALMGTYRITPPPPPPGGLFPFLQDEDPQKHVRMVRFAHRGRGSGDGFYDFTARYGAVREGDRRTLRDNFFPEMAKPLHNLAVPSLVKTGETEADATEREKKQSLFEFLANRLRLVEFLDLPMVALSNGQTRRARIAKALLEEPRLLLLDEPLSKWSVSKSWLYAYCNHAQPHVFLSAGLDVKSRHILLSLLEELKERPEAPHVLVGLRGQDPVPDWTTHIALIEEDGRVKTGKKEDILSAFTPAMPLGSSKQSKSNRSQGEPLIDLAGVTVAYGPRKVLSDIRWTIRANARWHLIGENGAGKTTLLALLTGEHPQSYTQSANLRLFGRERAEWATPLLHQRIGRVSPELFNAFPRRHNLTVWHAVGTGFDGSFVPKGRMRVGLGADGLDLAPGGAEEARRVARMREVMRALGPSRWHAAPPSDEEFFERAFVDLTPGEQSMVLLMRALVGQPPLVLLDEAWAGMDRAMVQAAHQYLADGGGGLTKEQACIVVSHWEEEVPWGVEHGVERYRLDGGVGEQLAL